MQTLTVQSLVLISIIIGVIPLSFDCVSCLNASSNRSTINSNCSHVKTARLSYVLLLIVILPRKLLIATVGDTGASGIIYERNSSTNKRLIGLDFKS
ncbi:unnamed protein product [Schistosoma mattheei]|uniref:Uncharacterized protein n=1 Tax=Schistosoma mattheei TaxID=31246 RepID=A0A183PTZ2_9TREM|nr:unnamed protein product [Schistosoma mattheei]